MRFLPVNASALSEYSLFNENANGVLIGFIQSLGNVFDRQLIVQEEVTDRNFSFCFRGQLNRISRRRIVIAKDMKAIASYATVEVHPWDPCIKCIR